jgi:hypothetical protein
VLEKGELGCGEVNVGVAALEIILEFEVAGRKRRVGGADWTGMGWD